MSIQKEPVFKAGNILTHDMLALLKEAAFDSEHLRYAEYSDGVLNGCDITTSPGQIKIGKGIIIIKSKLFYLYKEQIIPIEADNDLRLVVARAGECEESFDYISREVNIRVISEEALLPGDVELCRFRLQEGAVLRSSYKDFMDMNTEYDTVCLKYSKWAAYKAPSISLVILHKFMEEAIKNNIVNAEDRSFLGRIAATDGTTLNATELNMYLSWKLNQPYIERDSKDIYKGLADVLRMFKGEGAPRGINGRMEPRRMIID